MGEAFLVFRSLGHLGLPCVPVIPRQRRGQVERNPDLRVHLLQAFGTPDCNRCTYKMIVPSIIGN